MINFLKKLRSKNIFSLIAIDLSCGIIVYAIISYLFGKNFDYKILALSIFFAFLPDMDFIPFVFLRNKVGMLSHQLIHYPLILISSGFFIALFLTNKYIALLFLVGVTIHFINDTTDNLGGIKWLWPFSGAYFAFRNGKVVLAKTQRDKFYSTMKKGADERNIFQELSLRTTVENRDLKHKPITLYILAVGLIGFFVL